MMRSSDLSSNVLTRLIRLVLLSTLLGHVRVAAVQFLTEPEDVTKTYTYGSTGTDYSFILACKVDSLESDQKVSWFKNGEIISDGYDFRDNVKGNLVDVTNDRYRIIAYGIALQFTIQVRSASPSNAEFDSGRYQCAVTWWQNDVAVPDGRSRTAVVNIYVIPTLNFPLCKILDSTHQEVNSNPIAVTISSSPYTLTCLSSPSSPSVTLFLSRNDQAGPLPRPTPDKNDDGLFYISYNWTPSRNDGSSLTFTCTLQHPGLSSDRTCSLNFNIQYAPIVTIHATNIMVTGENDEIVLQCKQDANPQVTETVWYYDDGVVNSGDRFRLEGMSLRISTFSSRDNGDHTVTCELTNVIGKGNDSVTLTVNIPTPSPKVTLLESTPSPKVTLREPVQRTASSGITFPDYQGRTTIAANKSHSTDPFAIPRKTDNTGIIIGSVVGVCLLIAVIIMLVILMFLKTRRKSSQSPKSSSDNFDARRGERGGDVIGIVREDTTSPGYESTNGAFGNEYSDIALELGGRAILKIDGNNKTAASDADHRSDTVNFAGLYSKPKKKPKPPKKHMNDEGKTTESETVHHSDTVTSADLYSKPKKKPKPPRKQMDDESKTTGSETVHHSDMVTLADLYSKPKKKPKPPKKQMDDESKTTESEAVHHSDTVTSADLYSKPKKKPKPPKKQMDDESKTTESEAVHHSDMVTSADLYSKPKKKPKPPYKKNTNQQKTEDEQYANVGLKAKAKSGTQSEEHSVDPDMSPYANMSEKKNRATDSLYDAVNNSTSTDADVPKDYFGGHKQRRGDPEVSQAEKPAFTKNAEGLTYAELDLSSTSVTSRPMKTSEAENTVYADLRL